MKEYVEREIAVGAVEYIACRDSRVFSSGAKYREIIQAIQEAHAADVAPIIHAYWIDTDRFDFHCNPIYECSNCHKEVADTYINCHKFCLHCGAKMDGGN